ncbi:mechanosensitive ion channel family protein [Methanocella sp. CWC-04]|uniref:Mechanosensitive ion channel family protein n=1 Tax=Methanooceanicella nereidis TaxID=2052831 RepID=A0AAP2RDH0_9EURY|nr:mechanosensitive ion channel family protein [Methanocella sp. CWC-04]MCD1295087.1 mechanosensitive ion channel family protein [Methanocella sp. CWC-04]
MNATSSSFLREISDLEVLKSLESDISNMTGLSTSVVDILIAVAVITLSVAMAMVVKYFIAEIAPKLVSRTNNTLDDEILKALNGPAQVSIIVLGTYIAIGTIKELPVSLSDNIGAILIIVLIFIAAYFISNLINAIIKWYRNEFSSKGDTKLDNSVMQFFNRFIGVVIYSIAILTAISQLGIEITPMLASLGVAGIAVALAAQELLSNIFGAFAILSDRPYKVGDRIELSSGEYGDVVDIGLRSTRLRTLDNKIIVIPNSDMSKSRINNYSEPDYKLRYTIRVGISYNSDAEKAIRILEEIAGSMDGAMKDPKPKAYISELGEYSVNLTLLVWGKNFRENWDIPDRVMRKVLKRFPEEGIEIPFPTTSVLMKKDKERMPGVVVEAIIPNMIEK